MKITVLIDNDKVTRWQRDAIDSLTHCEAITVLSCRNTSSKRRPVKHGLYYLLNRFSLKNRYSMRVPVAETAKKVSSTREFDSLYEGLWQRLPDDLLAELRADPPNVILKFGMGLLRVPSQAELPTPILSYHHGDPATFRGRPAGFYEILSGERVMGQIIQELSNKLDAGGIVAFAQTKVFPYSYKATASETYRHSPLLLNRAVTNLLFGNRIPIEPTGENYRLPTNGTVARFMVRMLRKKVSRLWYGAFVEKRWNVSTATVPGLETLDTILTIESVSWNTSPPKKPYTFYADPFFLASGDVLVEAMNGRTGKGELLRIEGGRTERLTVPGEHYSYPCVVEERGEEYVVPEVAAWAAPTIFRIAGGRLEPRGALRVANEPRLLDPTLTWHEGRLYLFANIASIGANVLYLWSSPSLFERFELHPASPVRMSPVGGRMAGGLVSTKQGCYRLGQDLTGSYGDGVFMFRVLELTPTTYREEKAGRIGFDSCAGPHTINLQNGRVVFDWYRDKFSPIAGVRRLIGRLR